MLRILRMLRNFFGGLIYNLALFFCSFFGSLFLMGPTIPLLWLRPQWFRWANDRLCSLWLILPPVRNVGKQFLNYYSSWAFFFIQFLLIWKIFCLFFLWITDLLFFLSDRNPPQLTSTFNVVFVRQKALLGECFRSITRVDSAYNGFREIFLSRYH